MVIYRRRKFVFGGVIGIVLLGFMAFVTYGIRPFRGAEAASEVPQTTLVYNYTSSGATQTWTIPNHAVKIKGELWGGGGGGGGCRLCGYNHAATTYDARVATQGGGGGGGGVATFDWGTLSGTISIVVGGGGTGGAGSQSENGYNPGNGSTSCSNGGSFTQSNSRAWAGCMQAGNGQSTTISHPSQTTVTASGGSGGYSAAGDSNGGSNDGLINYNGSVSAYGFGGSGGTGGSSGQSGYASVGGSGPPMRIAGDSGGWCAGASGGVCGSGGAGGGTGGGAGGTTEYSYNNTGGSSNNNIKITQAGNGRSSPGVPGGGGSGGGGLLMIRGDDCINADGGSGANGQLKIDYSIFTAQVSVTSISPNKGLISPYSAGANRTVTITGNFADVDFAQPYSITFGGTAATIISGSSSQIVVSYPDWATAGAVDVRIAFTDNSYGFTDWDYSLGSFTYEAPYLNINPSTPETLTISYSPSDVLPPNGVFAVKTAKTVSTNNPLGYTLTMAPQSGTNLVCATNGSLTINTIGSAGALSVGTYGYKTATSDQTGINTGWNPVSSNQQIKNVPSPIENDPINVWFGVRLAPNVAPCSSYSQTFVWTLTPNV